MKHFIESTRVHRIGARRGFTLIETIAAMVVLALAVPPMLWAIQESYVQRVNPMMASKARWLATEKLEDIIADRHSTTRGYSYLTSSNYPTETSISDYPGFTRSVTLTKTEADLVTVGTSYTITQVNVTWTDATTTSRTLSVATVLTEYTSP